MIVISAYRVNRRQFKTGTGAFVGRYYRVGKWIIFIRQEEEVTEQLITEADGLAHDDRVDSHHWIPKREGRLGNDPTYVQHCSACGAYYRHGQVTDK